MRSDQHSSSHRASGPTTHRRCWAKSRSTRTKSHGTDNRANSAPASPIQTKTGKVFEREQSDYEGGLGNALSWEREVEKFNWLSEPFADAALRNDIIELVADPSPNIRSMT